MSHITHNRDRASHKEQAQQVARAEDRKVEALGNEKLDLSEQSFNWDEAEGKERTRVTKYSGSQITTAIVAVTVITLIVVAILFF